MSHPHKTRQIIRNENNAQSGTMLVAPEQANKKQNTSRKHSKTAGR